MGEEYEGLARDSNQSLTFNNEVSLVVFAHTHRNFRDAPALVFNIHSSLSLVLFSLVGGVLIYIRAVSFFRYSSSMRTTERPENSSRS